MTESFPRQYARTRRFTLGEPRNFTVAQDGSRVAFLRSSAGDDPVNALWVFDVEAREERLVADPRAIVRGDGGDIPQEERARRERARELAEGIVDYAVDDAFRIAAFALNGRLFVANLETADVRELNAATPVFDPRPDPTGRRVAYVSGRALRVVEIESGADRILAEERDEDVSWGMAEFVAAEEMYRRRGYWWSPDGERVVAERADNGPLETWYIADPSDPSHPPTRLRYPVAGGGNSIVTLAILAIDGSRIDVEWDTESFEYLVGVTWPNNGPLTLLVQSRDQRTWQVLEVDDTTGATKTIFEDRDDKWLEILTGAPRWTPDGRLVFCRTDDRARYLTIDGRRLTPDGVHVDRVTHVGDDVVFLAYGNEPAELHVWRSDLDGTLERLTTAPGLHDVEAADDLLVVTSESMEQDGARTSVIRKGEAVGTIESRAERPSITPKVEFLRLGPRQLSAALLLPSDHTPGAKLPVLLDPYGGPHAQRVVRSRRAFLVSQWFADQGFAVLVVDGRGTPGRDPAWEKLVHHATASTLDDQVEALHAIAAEREELDLSRVAIRGWSFGGYLAALAVVRRPDVFHAAVAGAPVTDERLYDTHYNERYLGLPQENPEVYDANSVLPDAKDLKRPLLLIHGVADDNVFFAHTLKLSQVLLEAGQPHTVIPLSGITHMAMREGVIDNLLLLQLEFLRRALGDKPVSSS